MPHKTNPIVETYSQLAENYDDEKNLGSCWGRAAEAATATIVLQDNYGLVVDVGCGTGHALASLAAKAAPEVQFVGIEPADNMRKRAEQINHERANVRILDGRFESLPLESGSVDYLYSIMAFHWTTDPEASVAELSRVMADRGEMDLIFIGRQNGREFIKKTSPIFLKYMGPAQFLASARMRKQLSREEAETLFANAFDTRHITVEESFDTYHDSLEGHWGWWVRIEGHFIGIPEDRRSDCYQEVQAALATLDDGTGIPYTLHNLHVRLKR